MINNNMKQIELWEKERKKFDLKYPDNYVIRFLKRNYKTGKGKTILDFGCGSGRNSIVMADMEFDIVAMDYSKMCLELTKEKMEQICYDKITYVHNEKLKIDVKDQSLDCIVAWGILFYFNKKEREQFREEIKRVLKPGGLMLADYRSVKDSMYGKGIEAEENLYYLNEEAGSLKNLLYWFCTKEDLKNLYDGKGFDMINLERVSFFEENLSKHNEHYHIWLKRA